MYSIKDLALISGLTDRTLRNYLKMGILVGEKKNGVWSFSENQIDEFLKNEYVRASISSNRRSVIFDYLTASSKGENTACIILNLPEDNSKDVSHFFCEAVNKGNNLRMTFDVNKGSNTVILTGRMKDVCDIVCEYDKKYHQKKD